jgi:hypothetical protein
MAKVPGFARAIAGRWHLVEMDNWDSDFLDLVEEAHLTFEGKSDGEIAFGALKGFLDVRYGARDGSACAEFSWEGHDENDRAPRGRELPVREGLTRIIVDWSGSWQAARPGNWLGRSPATKAALGR